jgi:hypothetical protein
MSILPGLGALLAAHDAGALRERAEAILREGGYQVVLPRDPGPPTPLELPLGPLALLLRILLVLALVVLLALAVSWLARRLGGAGKDAVVEDAAPPAPGAISQVGAAALAAQGRWAEAIHALLLDTLEALSRGSRLAPSLTSREIVERVPLEARAREALAGLVAAVEISRFGGAAADEDDYRACLSRFHAFLATYRGPA